MQPPENGRIKVLVVGRSGQVARSLLEQASAFPNLQVDARGRPDVDLARSGDAARIIQDLHPHVVVNAAAYTGVDKAEQEPDATFRLNGASAGELAEGAANVGAPIIHLSTDYVFSGQGSRPWRPDDTPHPLGVYGASKLAGEEAVRTGNPNHLILRTSWVFSPFGSSFPRTMLRLARERNEVRVVADQFGRPTSALSLAGAILAIIDGWRSEPALGLGQTFHAANRGECSWAQFAEAIFAASAAAGGPSARVTPISTSEFPTPARRPAYSVLDCTSFEQMLGRPMEPWREALPAIVARLLCDV